jgi:flagellar hook-length control protein FliK
LLSPKGVVSVKGLLGRVSFGSQLQQKLDQIGADGSDVLSQLAGMLQAGTPLATIIDRVAKTVSNALAKATGNDGNAARRGTLERALAAALAPPGTSPPNQSGAQQVASLEQRLGDLLSKLTGVLKNAGQQNRFSGQVLDANSARETPAQQQTKDPTGTQTPAGILASAESILKSVLQQLQTAVPQSTQQQQPAPQIAQQDAVPQITVQSADVLGRMLARAAKADPAQPAARTIASASGNTGTPASSDLFTRLMNVIAQGSSERSGHESGKQSQEFTFAKNSLPGAPAFATAVNSASAAQQPASAQTTQYAVDPQSVIEQVVKGIVLRNSGTTSEVRMRLQPEHLGDVSLKLTVSGNTISANIVAQNADVRDMLLSNQQQLARTLADAGLSLGNFSVDVSGGNPGFSQQQSQQQRSLSKVSTLHLDAAAEDDSWADPRFGPPVFTGARSLVLNYLA